jgi:hypothetical protein
MDDETPETPDTPETPAAATTPEPPAPPEPPFFAEDAPEVDVDFGEPTKQSRITIAFRALLALPHIVVLAFLGIVAFLLIVIGWPCALVLGRLPRWIARYQMAFIAYSTRVSAYQSLLAGQFPAFAVSREADYSTQIEIHASRLSRLKVLFRFILVFPKVIVLGVVGWGIALLSPIIWLITLVRGRMPQSLFRALAAVHRYQARYTAYISLVTDAYPRGLFEPQWGTAPDGEGRERQPLSTGARRMLKFVVILGIVLTIAGFAVGPVILALESPQDKAARRLEEATLTFRDSANACGSSPAAWRCYQGPEREWARAFERFASDLSIVDFPASKQAAATALIADAHEMAQDLISASNATNQSAHEGRFVKADEELLGTFETDAKRLYGHTL